MAGELAAGIEVAESVAQLLFPTVPVNEAVELAKKLSEMHGSGGVVELTEEELDAFQREALEGMR